MKRRNVRTLSLIVVTFTYLLIGAAIFDVLEGPNNDKSHIALNHTMNQFKEKYQMSEDDYRLYELIVIERKPHRNGPQWKFAGAFYYALVVLTLIGYGHSTANTQVGKIATMVYAAIGIPIALVMFQCMGERMNRFFSVIIKKVRGWLGCSRVEANEIDLITASGTTSGILIASGATLYHYQENWTPFNSLYYSFITLSTIGFGDYVALQEGNSLTTNPTYVVCSFLFLLLGLASFASSVNLLVLRFMILSLEEDEQEELQDVAQNVITVDEEVIAANGRLRGGPLKGLFTKQEADVASVCSCTCYGNKPKKDPERLIRMKNRKGRNRDSESETTRNTCRLNNVRTRIEGRDSRRPISRWSRFWRFVLRIFGFRHYNTSHSDDSNYYDEETQSISNYARYAVKRASL